MDASKRMVLAKALKAARATKAGASYAPTADPNLSLTNLAPTSTDHYRSPTRLIFTTPM